MTHQEITNGATGRGVGGTGRAREDGDGGEADRRRDKEEKKQKMKKRLVFEFSLPGTFREKLSIPREKRKYKKM